ncbi:MAG: DNA polymerase III subunit alpha [Deltaproteobacteria bacterium]|nr:MAG: DNA polymerase III subunit alpha [Deltaproteobacteria bacterium]
MTSPPFVHLHVHSHYSLLDSTVKIPDLMRQVQALGMDAVALTDHANLFGAVEFQQKAGGTKPIFGVEVNLLCPARDGGGEGNAKPSHLVLLAENLEGYRNLLRLVSRSAMGEPDRSGRPLTAWADLEELSGGLIALSGDLGGEIPRALLRGDLERAEDIARRLSGMLGPGRFFLELQRHPGVPEQQQACDALVALAERLELPVVATNNVHYLREGDHVAHGVLMCIGLDKRVDRALLEKVPLRDLWLKSPQDMAELFADLPEALENSVRIAERCNVEIPLGQVYLPQFPIPDGHTTETYFREVAAEGLEERFAELEAVGRPVDRVGYRERLETELGIIIEMGFPGYFLIVWDFIAHAKREGIPVGPGRGSGAGSLVAWALRITDIDPIPYDLLFERFLNPERVSMPDFDIDFCQTRRQEVIDYVSQKYGADNVAMIVTFGQLKARAVVKDVARVLNLSFADADRLAKLIPEELNIRLKDAWDREPRLRELVEGDRTYEFLFQTALALENNNRNTGMHAAGVVMSEEPLWEYVPVYRGSSGELVSQYAKNEVEAAGLVKFDFLGLKTLTVIEDAVRLANQQRPANDPVDFRRIPLDEPEPYALIRSGDTTGVFQMESEGFQRLVRQLRPDCFEDIVAAVALYRPGPLGSGMVEQYIDCKHGRRAVEYPHPWLEETLRETYGVIVYQEQVMKVAQLLAGYSLGGADLLRRAMGKKKPEEMDRQRTIFVEGAAGKGIEAKQANEIFDLMAHFAGYGFNKSHSAAYAVLTFQTAWLKANHPTAFYAALMTNDADKTDKVVRYIHDARSRGIDVLPPDVNESEHSFSVAGGRIRFGLGAVKGIGAGPVEAIIDARAKEPFASLFDFCDRVDLKRCSKRTIEALVRCGAFDAVFPGEDEAETLHSLMVIGRRRARMLAALDAAFERGQKTQADRVSGQESLFGMFATTTPAAEEGTYPEVEGADDRTVLAWEKQALGFYVSGHPLDRYTDEVGIYADTTSTTLSARGHREDVALVGIITGLRERPLKNGGGTMAFFQLEDRLGEVEVVVYSRVHETVREILATEDPVIVRGQARLNRDGDEVAHAVIAEEVIPLQQARSSAVRKIEFELDASAWEQGTMGRLERILSRYPGTCETVLRVCFPAGAVRVALPADVRVAPDDDLVRDAERLLGERCARFR